MRPARREDGLGKRIEPMESSETLSFQPGSHFQASLRQPLPTVQGFPR